MYIFCLVLALGLTLAGCGGPKPPEAARPISEGNSVEPPTRPPTQPPAQIDTRPAIVAFGNSLTAGFGAEPGHSYPDFLQKDLDGAGFHWRVINAGVSGDTTTDGVNRLGEVLAYKPRIVIVEFGGNDGLRGLPIETTRVNLDQIVATLRNAGVKVILAGMTLPPNYGPDYIRTFEQIYRDLAAKYKVPRIPFLLEGVATMATRNLMQRDGLHPTGPGNAVVAETVMRYLKPTLD
ncbi:MAG TPA: arylesterase [Bryobacteraceae bacterium]|jgi:acyl-CoA thioesterase-1|nr:arylesterase [Bryobacteraceae bacterium]HWY47775.1 arylesterase [Bryobacteraceae bacterium]